MTSQEPHRTRLWSSIPGECMSKTDLFNIASMLTDEELAVRDKVADFVDRRVRPNIARWYDEATLPMELIPEMAELGLLGMHIDGYGRSEEHTSELQSRGHLVCRLVHA